MKTAKNMEEAAKALGCSVEQLYQLLKGKEGMISVDTRYMSSRDIKDMEKEEVEDRIKFLETLGKDEIEKDNNVLQRYKELNHRLNELIE